MPPVFSRFLWFILFWTLSVTCLAQSDYPLTLSDFSAKTSARVRRPDRDTLGRPQHFQQTSADPRWENISLENRGPFELLFIREQDTTVIKAETIPYPESDYCFNYPYFWVSLSLGNGLDLTVNQQTLLRYDAETGDLDTFRLAFPFGDNSCSFAFPSIYDEQQIWYYCPEEGLFSFDKTDLKSYRYGFDFKDGNDLVSDNWRFLNIDSHLLYFDRESDDSLLLINKRWLVHKRQAYPGAAFYLEIAAAEQQIDSLDLDHAPNLPTFMVRYKTLEQAFAASKNPGLKQLLDLSKSGFAREFFRRPQLAEETVPLLQVDPYRNLAESMPEMYEGLMFDRLHHTDLTGWLQYYWEIIRAHPGYFEKAPRYWNLACINRILIANGNVEQIKTLHLAEPDFLWKKAMEIENLLNDQVCESPYNKPARLATVGQIFADLVARYPDHPNAKLAVCRVLEWPEKPDPVPLDMYETLVKVKGSNCLTGLKARMFYAYVNDASETGRKNRLLKAIKIGEELSRTLSPSQQKSDIETMLPRLRVEYNQLKD